MAMAQYLLTDFNNEDVQHFLSQQKKEAEPEMKAFFQLDGAYSAF